MIGKVIIYLALRLPAPMITDNNHEFQRTKNWKLDFTWKGCSDYYYPQVVDRYTPLITQLDLQMRPKWSPSGKFCKRVQKGRLRFPRLPRLELRAWFCFFKKNGRSEARGRDFSREKIVQFLFYFSFSDKTLRLDSWRSKYLIGDPSSPTRPEQWVDS